MDSLRLDRLKTPVERPSRFRRRLWYEWCFLRAVIERRGISLVLIAVLLFLGGGLFALHDDPASKGPFVQAVSKAWFLVFAQPPPGAFPSSPVLIALLFLIPLLGLAVIIEAIVEISQMLLDRRKNEDTWCRIMANSMHDHIILVGLGRLGIRTFHLLRRLGHDVVVIERRADAQFLDDVRRDGSPILVGDARREAFLGDANVKDARSIVLATDDDLANLEIALDARRLNPRIRVVMRMFDPQMAEKVKEGFHISNVMSAASLAAPAFAMAALERGIVSSSVVSDTLLVTQRWNVLPGGALDGKTVADVMVEHGIGVVERIGKAGESRLFPSPDTRIAAEDQLLVQGPFERLVGHPLSASRAT